MTSINELTPEERTRAVEREFINNIDEFHYSTFVEWIRSGHVNDKTIENYLKPVQDWYWKNKEEILK
jgi:hypothetical protein